MFNRIRASLSSKAAISGGIAIFGSLLHGIQANELGLYWDDASQLLGSMQRAEASVLKFVLNGTFWFGSERPFAYLPFMAARAAFAAGLPALHWLLVILFVLNAVVLTNIALRLVKEEGFAFAVGVLFLSYPLSPLHVLYAALIHHLAGMLLALVSILFALNALQTDKGQRLRFALAALAYVASVLTHETFALVPPVFLVLHAVWNDREQIPGCRRFLQMDFRRPAVYCVALFLITFIAYGLWREAVLPVYGGAIYSTATITLDPAVIAEKFAAGATIALSPWEDALRQILSSPLPDGYVLLSIMMSAGVGAVLLFFQYPSRSGSRLSSEEKPPAPQSKQWLQAASIGIALAIAGVITISLSPVSILSPRKIFEFAVGVALKANLPPTIGVALALPALLVLLVVLYHRSILLGALLTLSLLIYFGISFSFLDIQVILSPSTFFTVLSSYSLKHRLAIFAYIVVVTVVSLVVIASSVPGARLVPHFFTGERMNSVSAQVGAYFLSVAVACLVLVGSLYHFSVKQQFISAWEQHKSMLEQLQRLAPSLKENTFVVIVRDRDDPVSPSHYGVSSYLLALYDEKSIMGNNHWQLRFYPDGVKSTYYGRRVARNNDRISYDRLLIFEFDGRNLRMLPKIEVKTEVGKLLVVLNNPHRILSEPAVRTADWRYLH